MTDASLRQPLHELIGRFCAAAAVDEPELLGHPAVVSLALDLPIELSVERDGDGTLVVLGSRRPNGSRRASCRCSTA